MSEENAMEMKHSYLIRKSREYAQGVRPTFWSYQAFTPAGFGFSSLSSSLDRLAEELVRRLGHDVKKTGFIAKDNSPSSQIVDGAVKAVGVFSSDDQDTLAEYISHHYARLHSVPKTI